jgi:hypothetical protein
MEKMDFLSIRIFKDAFSSFSPCDWGNLPIFLKIFLPPRKPICSGNGSQGIPILKEEP